MNSLSREIRPVGPISATIRPPGSKSLTNRALLCAALADGQSHIGNALVSDDTRYMIGALRALGLRVHEDAGGTEITVTGCDGRFPCDAADLFVGDSGTAMRFLTAALTVGEGRYTVDGDERMRERPIGDLIDGLRQLGADVSARDGNYPPVTVCADGVPGGECSIDGRTSSQFISAVLMASPYAKGDVTVRVANGLVSAPYVAMTRRVMADYGVTVEEPEQHTYHIAAGQRYRARHYAVEPDASAASYWFGAAAITGGSVRVEGIGSASVQGDVAFVDLLRQMGCEVRQGDDWTEVTGRALRGIVADMADISDTAMTLVAVALFAHSTTTIRGIANVRVKESDRIAAVVTEARKLGARVDELPDGMIIHPAPLHGAVIETYDDHRVAMSFAVVGLRLPGVVLTNPGCVAKTYPTFFDELARFGA